MNHADLLSRLTNIRETQTRNVAEDYVNFVARTAIPRAMTAKEIEDASASDEELVNVRRCIKTGNCAGGECASYKSVRNELCVLGKLALRGTGIVVPEKLPAKVIELGHEGHQRIYKIKQR